MKKIWCFALKEDASIEIAKFDEVNNRPVEGSKKRFGPDDKIDVVPGISYEILRAEANGFIEVDENGKTFTIVPSVSGTA